MKYGNLNLNGKVSIVTGASGDIGSAIAEALLERDAFVNAVYNKNEEPLNKLAKRYEKIEKFQIDFLKGDYKEKIKNLVEGVHKKHKNLDILLNVAGIWEMSPFLYEEVENHEKMMRINCEIPYIFSKSSIRYMIGKPETKHIINIASTAGVRGVAQQISYSMSKAALRALTQALSEEFTQYGINVNSISPGPVDSKALEKYFPDERAKKLLSRSIPKYSLCKIEDVVNACLGILMNDYLTGADIILHGGREPIMK